MDRSASKPNINWDEVIDGAERNDGGEKTIEIKVKKKFKNYGKKFKVFGVEELSSLSSKYS